MADQPPEQPQLEPSKPRIQLDPIEFAIQVKAALERGVTLKRLAQALQMSTAQILRWQKLLDFPVETQQLVRDKKISVSHCLMVHMLVPQHRWLEYTLLAVDYPSVAKFIKRLEQDFPKPPTQS